MAVVSDVIGSRYTHAEIDNLMERAGIERDGPPAGNRQVKTRAWLRTVNQTASDPLAILGKVLIEPWKFHHLLHHGILNYTNRSVKGCGQLCANMGWPDVKGGYVTKSGATLVSKTLEEIIGRVTCPVSKPSSTGFTKMKNRTRLLPSPHHALCSKHCSKLTSKKAIFRCQRSNRYGPFGR